LSAWVCFWVDWGVNLSNCIRRTGLERFFGCFSLVGSNLFPSYTQYTNCTLYTHVILRHSLTLCKVHLYCACFIFVVCVYNYRGYCADVCNCLLVSNCSKLPPSSPPPSTAHVKCRRMCVISEQIELYYHQQVVAFSLSFWI